MAAATHDQGITQAHLEARPVALPAVADLLNDWLSLTRRAGALLDAAPDLQAQLAGSAGAKRRFYGKAAQDRTAAAASSWRAIGAKKQALERQAEALGYNLPQLAKEQYIARKRAAQPVRIAEPEQPEEQPAPAATVAVFGHVAAAALKRKEARLFQLWALMRHHDKHGAGRLPVATVYEIAGFLHPANLRAVIRKGIAAGYFRREPNGYLGYAGQRQLCHVLGITRVKGRAVAVPVDELATDSRPELGALLYDAALSSRGEGYSNPIARGGWHHGELQDIGIKAMTGLSRPTQRKYEAMRSIKPRANVEDLGAYEPDRLQALQAAAGHNEARPFVLRQRGGARIVRRLPNAYHGTLAIVRRGRRRLNEQLTKETGRALDPLANLWRSELQEQIRRYHDKQGPAAKQATASGVKGWLWQGYDSGGRIGLYTPVMPEDGLAHA